MKKYIDENCTICNETIKNDDVVNVCPDCGAPFHKSCYNVSNICKFCETNNNKFWQSKKTDNKQDIRSEKEKASKENIYNGISRKDLQLYIGKNSEYFINQFERVEKDNKKASFNWPAFLITPFYLFYRKLYVQAMSILFINTLIMYYLDDMKNSDSFILFIVLPIIIFLYFGIKFNYIYTKKMSKDIKHIKNMYKENSQYEFLLSLKGGTSIIPIIILIGITFLRRLI